MSIPLFDMSMDEPKEQLDFESSLKRLEAIVSELETDELGLQDALKRYEEGVRLAKMCSQLLRDAELRVQELASEPDADQ